jgi:hypothetical protein
MALLATIAIVAWGVRQDLIPGGGLMRGWPMDAILLGTAALVGIGYTVLRRAAREPSRPVDARRLALVSLTTAILAAAPGANATLHALVVGSPYLSTLYLLTAFASAVALVGPPALRRRLSVLLRPLLVPLCAVVLVALTETWIEWRIHLHGQPEPLSWAAFGLNTLLLGAVMGLVVTLTGRRDFGIVVAGGFYLLLAWANVEKFHFLRSPVHPADLWYLPDLSRAAGLSGALPLGITALLFLASTMVRWRFAVARSWARQVTGVVASLLILSLPALLLSTAPLPFAPGMFGLTAHSWVPVESMRANGVLLDFFFRLPEVRVQAPAGYSAAAVSAAIARHAPPATAPPASPRTNLIVYVVEAMVDPDVLGATFSMDPTPTLHRLLREYPSSTMVSPVFGHASANVEFELFTGIPMAFLPPLSLPFTQYLHRPLPAVPRRLAAEGYRTTALHVESLHYYNYQEAYRHLGFAAARTLYGDPALPLDAARARPTDDALVTAVIREAERGGPYFIFAFPNSTHWPWDYPAYRDAPIEIIAPVLPEAARLELKTYVNALHTADRALARLVAHFADAPEPVVIAIIGDHHPALTVAAYPALREQRDVPTGCPFVLWSNRPTRPLPPFLSAAFVGSTLLRAIGILPDDYLAIADALAARLPVIHARSAQRPDGTEHTLSELTDDERRLLSDAKIVAYDRLFGSRQAALTPLP